MKVLKPFYYDNFKCVANECKESCCSGWSIDIDKKSYYKYKKVNGNFSEKLKEEFLEIALVYIIRNMER